jgi:deoxyribonuclease-2
MFSQIVPRINPLRVILLLGLFQDIFSASPSCLDQDGKKVDWWMMYKMPLLPGNDNPEYVNGYGYAYMDKNSKKWTVATDTYIDDNNIALSYTLAQIYDASTDGSMGWVLYNDEKPDGSTSTYRGHTKGAAAFDANGGFFLDHSVPRWPPAQSDSYTFPSNEATYGQSFLCVSLDNTNMDIVMNQWAYTYPNWYDTYFPSSLESVYQNFSTIVGGYHVKDAPWTSVETLETLGGTSFTYLAKYSTWGEDFYEDLVAPTLDIDMMTETWQDGSGKLPSFCSEADVGEYDYTVLNVVYIDLGSDVSFKETKDHSKWGVSLDSSKPWTCIGDMNRVSGQESRAGGTLCLKDSSIWMAYNGTISEIESC